MAAARVAAAPLAGLLLVPGSAFAFPVAVTDDRCRTIEIQRQPQRMVALLPLYSEVLLDLNPAATVRIVGIADAPGTPPELAQVRSVGPSFAASRELIVALEPDVVLGATDYNGLRAHLEDVGITVFTAGCFAGTPDFGAIHGAEDIFAVIDALDRLSSAPAARRGPELVARIRRGLDRVEQLVAGRSRPTAAVLYADLSRTAPPTVAGSGTPEYGALARAGGEPGFAHQGYAPVSFEELVRVDPTYLIADPAHVAHLLNDPRLARLTAVRERRVCAIPAARWTSSRVAATVRAVAELLHPAAFGRVAASCAP